jgi:hypothetical protein
MVRGILLDTETLVATLLAELKRRDEMNAIMSEILANLNTVLNSPPTSLSASLVGMSISMLATLLQSGPVFTSMLLAQYTSASYVEPTGTPDKRRG